MATSARRRTEAGGQEAWRGDSVRTRRAGAGPRVWPGPREPCQPQRPGGRPVCRPTAGPAQAPSPPPAEDGKRLVAPPGGRRGGRPSPPAQGGRGRTTWLEETQQSHSPGRQDPAQARGPRARLSHGNTRGGPAPPAPHALPAPPGPCTQARPLGASRWRLPGPRRSRQNAHPPTRGRTAWAVGVTPRGGPVPPSRSGADGAGASLGTPSALHDTLTLQASGGRDAGPGLRLTKTHARHSKERRNRTSE